MDWNKSTLDKSGERDAETVERNKHAKKLLLC